MSALAKRCSTSLEACVRRCRRATSPAKRMRSTPRSRRSRRDTDRRSGLRLPLLRPRRRPRPQPESRTRRLRGPLRRPLPQNSPRSSGHRRLRRPRPPHPRRDRLRKREPLDNPRPRTRLFRAGRSDLRRPRRNVASQAEARHKRQLRLRDDLPRERRPQLRPLGLSWLLQWPISPPPDRGPAGPLHPSRRRAARMRVCPEWRR
jgi:hypothetical protein